MTHVVLFLGLMVGAAAPDVQATESTVKQQDLRDVEQMIVQETNRYRAKYGLPACKVDPRIMETARRHGNWMASSRQMVHSRLYSPVRAENIAYGYKTPQQAVLGWMNSDGHRANILNRNNNTIGVGAYKSSSGNIYWCQQFGHK